MTHKIKIADAVAEYMSHLAAKRLAPASIKQHRICLKHLVNLEVTYNNRITILGNLPVQSLGMEHIAALYSAHSWGPGTHNSYRGYLNTFFGWTRARGYMDRDQDPMYGWRTVKDSKNKPHLRIPVSQWHRLFTACQHPLDRIVLATGLMLFLRASEQQHLKVSDINWDYNELSIYRMKTQDYDHMPITTELAAELRRWLDAYAALLGRQLHPDDHLIPARIRTPLYETGVFGCQPGVPADAPVDPARPLRRPYAIVQGILIRAGYGTVDEATGKTVAKQEGEHTLRRSGARAYYDTLIDQGYDGALRRVKTMLGHESEKQTEVYLGITLDRRQRNRDLAGLPMFASYVTVTEQTDDSNVIILSERERVM